MELVSDTGLRWTLRWQTDVSEAYDGTEQRASLASLPRQSFAGALTGITEADLAAFRALLAGSPADAFNLPLGFETVASVNAITGTTITIVPTYVDWNAADRYVYVRRPDGTAYVTRIASVGGGGATLTVDDSPPAGTWPAGLTTVTPIEALLLEDAQPVARWPRRAGRWNLTGRASTARALTGTGGGSLTQQDSIDVLDRRPLVDGQLAEALAAGIEFQDAGGAVASATVWTTAKPHRTLSFNVVGSQQRQWWKKWLTNRRGRWAAFLCPTWRPDLLATTFTAGAGVFRIDASYTDYLNVWWPSLAHRRVQVEFSDGSVIYRRITAAADVGGGIQELTLASALPGSLPGTVAAISFLELARLDTDEVSIEWRQAGVGRIVLPIAVVQG